MKRINVLFVCSRNRLRSRTATEIWKNSSQIDVRGRGTASSARRRITNNDLAWADHVVVMETRHSAQIAQRFSAELDDTPIHVLEIPDDYEFMQPELIDLLQTSVPRLLDLAIEPTVEPESTFRVEPGDPYDTIIGADTTLRPMSAVPHDFRLLARWFDSDEVLRWYGGESHRYSYEQVAEKYGPRCTGGDSCRATIIERHNAPVGYLQYYPVDEPSDYELDAEPGDFWALDLFIGEPSLWGKGVGTAAIRLLQEYLKTRGVRHMVIDPHLDNPRAIRAYEKCGFRRVGTLLRHELHDGRWCDCAKMICEF